MHLDVVRHFQLNMGVVRSAECTAVVHEHKCLLQMGTHAI